MHDARITPGLIDFRSPANPHGLRFFEGGEGAPAATGDGAPAGQGGQEGAANGTTGGQGAAATQGSAQAGAQSAAGEWDGKVESLPDPVQKMIRDLRAESADRRTKLTAAEQAQQDAIRALAKAAGIELPGETAPDPAQLTEQLTATQAQARQAAIELAVFKAAPTHQGDPNALLDSRSFLAKVADLDPASAEFTTTVDAAIKDAVTTNPKLKAAPAVGASAADHAGGSGEGSNRTPRPLHEAVASAYGTA
ncbi:hypothetical protein [Ornithinimicrobium cerasi]|uniref:hypothetical protein n=1 Tax=Ornithinimicrobium cerasi TaxID=2248773 RepID=UPI000EFDD361|nr:hypothetical protein [Ornithinimicrobium cerasi]